jgi:hypothetical protein
VTDAPGWIRSRGDVARRALRRRETYDEHACSRAQHPDPCLRRGGLGPRTGITGLVLFAAAWGLFSGVLGVRQSQILLGSFHWVVEVAHLAVGVMAIAVGGQLARAVGHRRIAPSTSA